MKISRNDPCMCGSGKKYKHCCGKDGSRLEASRSREKDHFISEPVPKVGNIPHFSKEYFTGLEPDDKICVYKLIYSSLLSPKLAEAASKVSNRLLERGRYEAGQIKACSSARGLIEMMTGGIDPLNHVLFRKKVLEIQEETIPLLMGELHKPTNDIRNRSNSSGTITAVFNPSFLKRTTGEVLFTAYGRIGRGRNMAGFHPCLNRRSNGGKEKSVYRHMAYHRNGALGS